MGEGVPAESDGAGGGWPGWDGLDGADLSPGDRRLVELMEEFRRRQRRRPDLAVRVWFGAPDPDGGRPRVGFVVEYCPDGRASAELVVREGRVTVEGPRGVREAALALDDGWLLDGAETQCPETLANHLLRLADGALGGSA